MIPKELEEECKNINVNIREMLHKNYDDEKIYQTIVKNFVSRDVCVFYLPAISVLLSLMIMGGFSVYTKDHESAIEDLDTSEIFKFYFYLYKSLAEAFNIGFNIILFYLIQNYRFDLNKLMGVAIMIPVISSFAAAIPVFFGDNKKLEKEVEEKLYKIFKDKNKSVIIANKSYKAEWELTLKFIMIDGGKTLLMQGVYMAYYFYYVSKVNTLQDKITAMKNNLNIAKGMKKLNELQTQQIVENTNNNEKSSNYSY